jgi:hypothetical protein
VAADPPVRGFVLRIAAGGAAGIATFQVSNDDGRTWFGWDPTLNAGAGGWSSTVTTGKPTVAGAPVSIVDGDKITVTFAGNGPNAFVAATTTPVAPADRWKTFYVSYPALRASNVANAMCEDCHRSLVHTSQRVRNLDGTYPVDGTNVFSHPSGAGVTLAGAYDRATIRDASGVAQTGTGDANRTNDLQLDGDVVRCTTCHAVHNADSNSLTTDP